MLKEGTIPIVDQPLIQAVKYALDQLGVNPDTLPKKKRRTCLDGVGDGGDYSYNGYFTIKLRTLEDGTRKIVVCDGATYDAEKGTSGESMAYVGGVYHTVEITEIPVPQKSTHVIAEFTPATRNDNGDVITESDVFVSTCDDLTSKEGFFSEIGLLRVEDTVLQIIQRHGTSGFSLFNNGTLFIDYYVRCNE
jgi:hypothetical protein